METLKNIHRELSDKEFQLREREKELDAREKQLVSKKRVYRHHSSMQHNTMQSCFYDDVICFTCRVLSMATMT